MNDTPVYVTERRFRCVNFESCYIILALKGEVTLTFEGMPDDCLFWRVVQDFRTDCFQMICAHPSFDPVPTNEYPPVYSGLLRTK